MVLKLRRWPIRSLRKRKSASSQGFTLIELLISIAIAGIIVTTLLSLVVDLLRIEQREARLGRVQQDTQRAIDYISDDMKEAVYVYPDVTAVPDPASTADPPATITLRALLNDPNMPAGTDVLAFWRPTQIDEDIIPDDVAACEARNATFTEAQCQELLTRRAAYSLVMYIHAPFDGNPIWEGQSRLIRYELPRYSIAGNVLTERAGYVDPSTASARNARANDFENWAPTAAVDGREDVLVDFITAPDNTGGATLIDCDALTDTTATYVLSPPTASEGAGFYTCVRDPNVDLASLTDIDRRAVEASGSVFRGSQDVYVFLQGDASAEGASAFSVSALNPASDASRLPTLKTQVLVRGIVDRGTSQ